MANSVDPDETPHSAASHLGLNCLLRPVCPNTYGKYGIASLVCVNNGSVSDNEDLPRSSQIRVYTICSDNFISIFMINIVHFLWYTCN